MSEHKAIKDIDEREFVLADTLTDSLLKSLKEDAKIITKLDLINVGLIILNYFFCVNMDCINVKENKNKLINLVIDEEDFKDFFVESIMNSKYKNKELFLNKISEGDENGF